MQSLTSIWLTRLQARLPLRPRAIDHPLRGELLGREELEARATTLSRLHRVGNRTRSGHLLRRLHSNEVALHTFNRASLGVRQVRVMTPAAEWLLDNLGLITEQITLARRHLPRSYSKELPALATGPTAGLPRIYDLMVEFLSHTDAQVDSDLLISFVNAYRPETPLTLGELWAVPIMLRLGLIENLRRISARVTIGRHERDLADAWADRLENVLTTNPAHLLVVVAEMAQSKLSFHSAFVAQFCQRVSRLDPAVHFARHWLEQRIAQQGTSVEEMILKESRDQTADQASVSRSISSLRFLGSYDWRQFVETLSHVEHELRNDPAGVYARMDFATRDHYRHSVEQIARHSGQNEPEVARLAVQSARESSGDRDQHVGFHLADKGRRKLENRLQASLPLKLRLERLIRDHPLTYYLGGGALIVLLMTAYGVSASGHSGSPGWRVMLFGATAALAASQLAIALMNALSTMLVKPRLLPRMDFSSGVEEHSTTMVVVPTLLTSAETADQLVETLEIHYLANRDSHVFFALLTDFRDAPSENLPGDAELVARLRSGVDLLNAKYHADRPGIFYLFHRPRRWNPVQGTWMGYERKRGKLAEFNAVLRGHGSDRFSTIVGSIERLSSIRYVITLDTDTQLPRDAARKLIGTIAHPLNRPRLDPNRGIVVEGYGILQPRVGVSLPSAAKSWFVRLFAGDAGIDPYTRAVSDVYQDVFGEGSFIGKGIYDVDAFEQAMKGRFPENSILSHDLIESVHARSALVSDVELYEEHPSRYNADVNRRHRWIRGDWQISQWLLPRVPGSDARRILNPISALSRWKIFDNLRRSVVPLSLLILILGGGWLAPEHPELGLMLALLILFSPGLLMVARDAWRKSAEWPWSMHFLSVGRSLVRMLAQTSLTVLFLPYDAWMSLDAVGRTMARLLFTGKRLLEWQTSSDAERNVRTDRAGFYLSMWICPVMGTAVIVSEYTGFMPGGLPQSLIALSWILAPWAAWWISLPIAARPLRLTHAQQTFLRRSARRTWRFFETFVSKEEHWLPPDNYQEIPSPLVASRTSPTNIGLALLSDLAAVDLGYLCQGQLVERCRRTMSTLAGLERYRGHFYNWYDTRTLKPLLPHYVSTVDSGNLAASLMVLAAGLEEARATQPGGTQIFVGLRDTLGLLYETAGGPAYLHPFLVALDSPPTSLRSATHTLRRLAIVAEKAVVDLSSRSAETAFWSAALLRETQSHLQELEWFLPWVFQTSNPALDPQLDEELRKLEETLTLADLASETSSFKSKLSILAADADKSGHGKQLNPWAHLLRSYETVRARACQRLKELEELAGIARKMAAMDFAFLYDLDRDLFRTGYNVGDHRFDTGHYDLLASEARLASFVAIAQGQVPQEHWFVLGRLLASVGGEPVLISWSGSMFEYLMPLLVMPSYEGTLLDRTYHAAIHAQISYGKVCGVPWGISESGYNLTDAHRNYQYRAFGVPGLGFKRGLADDLVLAPYAAVMGLMVAPEEAVVNLERLAREGALADYGFYEAIDYTPSRVPPGHTMAIVKSYMAHHAGMSLLSLTYLLAERPMQRRFLSDPMFKAVDLMLHERTPKALAKLDTEEAAAAATALSLGEDETDTGVRIFSRPDLPSPEVHLLSNGRYHLMISSAGGGYSHWRDLALTRWREDSTRDAWGSFCYLRDLEDGSVFSATFQPTLQSSATYEVTFNQGRAEFRQRRGDLEIHLEISISPEDDVELRRLTLANHSSQPMSIEVTTCAEIVLAPQSADASHPAFSNLFVQTEFIPGTQSLLCARRSRSDSDKPIWYIHSLIGTGDELSSLSYETDRSKFIGRGRDLSAPAAMLAGSALSNTVGSVLDPLVALRGVLQVPAESKVRVEAIFGVGETREAAIRLGDKYRTHRMADRLVDLAWTESQVTLRNLGVTGGEAGLFSALASSLIYADETRRTTRTTLLNSRKSQSGLWSLGVSGDLPIALLVLSDGTKTELLRQVIRAHAYWRIKGLAADLVILNEDTSIYHQSAHASIIQIIESGIESQMLDKPGGIFVRRAEQLPAEDRLLLHAAARVILTDQAGSLSQQVERRASFEPEMPPLRPSIQPAAVEEVLDSNVPPRLFNNGLGGFTEDGKEYLMVLSGGLPLEPAGPPGAALRPNGSTPKDPRFRLFATPRRWIHHAESEIRDSVTQLFSPAPDFKTGIGSTVPETTPAPWVNVIANAYFGTVVSESGAGYSWLENSHEFRLTPWSNDPVSDPCGEAFYIRDEDTGQFWSPCPQPTRGSGSYRVRHGFGYSIFEHQEQGIRSELTVFVAPDAPVKFTTLRLRNDSGRTRRLTLFGYWEWVLGALRAQTLMHVRTEIDPRTGAILTRNLFSNDFGNRVAFVDVSEPTRSVSCDRKEFLGRHGRLCMPAALKRAGLSGRMGAGLDPCTAIQIEVELADQQEREVVFRLGAGRSLEEVQYLIQRFRRSDAAKTTLQEVKKYWERTLGAVHVETTDPSVNVMANGWLLYQTLSCRMWGRTGLYQSGGAYGFRDQLQDAMALVHAEPALLREQLLRAASRQFREGDVQHWWHPPMGRGVRTKFSDDYLWLPFATCRYVRALNDTGILDEVIPFLEARPLRPEEESYYDLPQRSTESASLYEHCVRAIRHGLRFGEHGLPLIGCGDWNDGLNAVGIQGRGESVWLAFFLYDVLRQFGEVAVLRGDPVFAEFCSAQADLLAQNIERHAWDGSWYRRAYFDDGQPLGSRQNTECQIDSLPQSWSVLSGAGDRARSIQSLQAVYERLVRPQAGLIQLFDPPFETSQPNPGYIKGYVPGVRENGGQYTHAAIWTVMALAQLGRHDRAWELFHLLNPVNHGKSAEGIAIYKVEPYVVAADVYAVPPHSGRGGWTWYTGSAGWMYRCLVESLLGIHREGDRLVLRPRLPEDWPGLKMRYRFHATFYHIAVTVRRENDPVTTQTGLYLDGQPVQGTSFPLQNDLATHTVELFLQAAPHGLELGPLQAASPPYTAEVYTAQDSPRG
jgi:cyclic beta-1,2-glucan synthetase